MRRIGRLMSLDYRLSTRLRYVTVIAVFRISLPASLRLSSISG
jgi:hypothetical protein